VEIAELVLKYIEALVWPAVTVGLVWGLRNQIRDAFTRMTRLETPAGAIEFETQARDVLNQAEAATIATPPGPFPPTAPVPSPRPWSPSPAPAGEPVPDSPAPAGEPVPDYEPAEEGLHPSPRGTPTPPPTPQGPPPSQPSAGSPWPPPPSPPYGQTATAGEPYWREQLGEARTMVDASPIGAVVTAWNALLSALRDVLELPEHLTGHQISRAMTSAELPPDTVEVFNRLRTLRNRAVHGADTVTPAAARDYIESCLHVARLVGNTRRP